MQELRQSTEIKIRIGSAVDAADGVTPETGLTLGAADQAELLKHNGAATVDMSGRTFAAVTGSDGWYDLTLTTTDTNTLGQLTAVVQDLSLMAPIFKDCMVVTQNYWDSKYSTDKLQVDVTQCGGSTVAAGAIPNAAADAAGGLPVSDLGGLDLDTKLANTNEISAARMGALTDWIDGGRLDLLLDAVPTVTEFNARTIPTADYFDPAADAVANVTLVATTTTNSDLVTAAVMADAVWDEILTGGTHNVTNSAGKRIREIFDAGLYEEETAQAGSNDTITLAAGASALDDFYNMMVLTIIEGTGAGQMRTFKDYNGTTKVATACSDWIVNPDATSKYVISSNACTGVFQMQTGVYDLINAECDLALADIHLDHLLAVDYDPASKPGIATALLNELVENDGGVSRYTANALEQAPSGGTNPNVLADTTLTLTDQTHFTLTSGSNDDDAYNDQAIVVYDASDSDFPSVRKVSNYVGGTRTVTLDSAPDFTMETGDGVKIFVTAPGTSAPTSAQNADAVWDELKTDHVIADSYGDYLDDEITSRNATTPPTVIEIRTEMDTNSTKMAPSQTLNDYKADVSALATSAALTTHDGKLDTVDTNVDTILLDTDELQTNQGDWLTATGFNTVIPDVAGIAAGLHATTDGKVDTAQTDLDKLTGVDGVTLATLQANYAPNKVIPDAAGVAPTVVEIRTEMDTNSTKMAPSQVLADYKATGFNTAVPDVAGTAAALHTTTDALINGLNDIDVAAIKAGITDGSYDLEELIRFIFSACCAKISGGGTTTIVSRDGADSKNRITATVDSSGNRTNVVLDGT